MRQLVYRVAAVLIIVACAFLLWLFILQGEAHGTSPIS
jgi:hypothetical protein